MAGKLGLEKFLPEEEEDVITPCTVTMESEISYHVVGSSGRKYAINQILQSGSEMVIIIFDTDDHNIGDNDDESVDSGQMKSNNALKQLALIACEESDISFKVTDDKCDKKLDTEASVLDTCDETNFTNPSIACTVTSGITITKTEIDEDIKQEFEEEFYETNDQNDPDRLDEDVEAIEDVNIEANETESEQEIAINISQDSEQYGEIIIKRETV